ncbi:carbohydrate ABC transporter permease [Falsiroseomonas sp. HW251]|uniref:carbohydrate ABC transporter permease n=1 Tax=Falsiroseomonas sp. HW251 TaxID=3390998 RepID=UPI003D3176FE
MTGRFKVPAWVALAFILPALACIVTFRVTPIFVSAGGSLMTTSLTGERVFAGLANYGALVATPEFWNSLRVTILFNAIITPAQVGFSFVMALLVLERFPGLAAFRTIFVLPYCISLATASLIFIVLMDPTLGVLNLLTEAAGLGRFGFFRNPDQALWSLMLLASWKGCGYWMIFLLAGLLAVPRETLEAARIDGAGYFQRLRHVVVPQMVRTFLFVLVADTVANFLLFAPIYIITQGGPNGRTDVLMHRGYHEAFGMLDHGAALAISTMLLLMVGSLAALMFRLMRER